MKKRICALLMAMTMTLSLLPANVLAAEMQSGLGSSSERSDITTPDISDTAGENENTNPSGNETAVSSWDDLEEAISEGSATNITLTGPEDGGDTLTATSSITISKDVTIDTTESGVTIVVDNDMEGPVFQVAAGHELTLGGEITLSCSKSLGESFLEVQAGGEATLEGSITVADGTNATESLIVCNGTLTMEDGGEVSGFTTSSTSAPAAVVVSGEGASFTMEGGEISDNIQTGGSNGIKGGAVQILNGAKFTMNGGEITGNNFYTGNNPDTVVLGGGVYVDDSTMKMNGGEISDNMAYQGGGVYLTGEGTSFTMTGGKISKNILANSRKATVAGGGVYVGNGCSFTMDSLDRDHPAEISGNHGTQYRGYKQYLGGGIYISGKTSTLILDEAVISNNRVVINSAHGGGGIYADEGAALTITDSKISNNSAFLNDTSTSYESSGGGINLRDDCTLTMSGTTISGNTAKLGGGLCLWGCSDVTITSCSITGNKTLGTQSYLPVIGAGIFYQSKNATLTITGTEDAPTVISGNEAPQGGGGLSNLQGTVKISNADITDNKSLQGGGIHSEGTTTLTNCTLSENDGSGAGGALSVGGGTTTLTGCTVEENTSSGEEGWGGGAYVAGGTLILDDTDLLENKATDKGAGGGVYLASGGTLEIKNGSSISSNTATEAGGIANVEGTVTFSGGTISNNTADMAGGVENLGTFNMSGGTITDNEATAKADGIGGGVANITGTFTMTGGAIYGNTAATGANDFYNYVEEEDDDEGNQSGGIDVDDSWEGDHNMGLESLSATRAAGAHGTFTLLPAKNFGYNGWFEDKPGNRYETANPATEYTVKNGDTSEQYLTLGEPLAKKYTVTFNENGGDTEANPTQVTVNENSSLGSNMPTPPTRDGYEFTGWNTQANGQGETFTADTKVTEDITVYAQWTEKAVDPDPGPVDPDPTPDPDDRPQGGGSDDSDPTGNLSISLDVNGGDDDFTFTVILTDKNGNDLGNNFYFNGDFTGTIGSGDQVTLEDGDTIVIRNLPEGTRYQVIIETADGYTYIMEGEEGIIHTGMNEADFIANRASSLADPSETGVDRWLNVTDHIAYLTGYPGDLFGPDNSMTRAEAAQMFYALLNNKNVTITKTFPDVPANAWYAAAVNTLASLGMVSGDEYGNYRPNDPITRAEFCVIALAFAYEPENAACRFTDVARTDWFYPYVAQAASYGWIGGYTDGRFGPNDRITRAQVTTIVNNMLGRAADQDYVIAHQDKLVQFHDLTRAHWAYFQIMEATNAHDYTKANGAENWF